MNELDNAIARLRKIHDNPNPHPDDVRLDVEGTIYELLAVKDRAEAAEADARRWAKFMDECSGNGLGFLCPWAETDSRWNDPQAAIDAELAKEAK